MATITPTVVQSNDGNLVRFTYASMTTTNNVGVAIHDRWAPYSDRTISVKGDFGAGGSVACEGTPDGGTTFLALTDPQGNTIAITAAKVEQVMEGMSEMRPKVTAGDGSTSVTVIIECRRQQTGRDGR
jgi:hypothetical protein